MKKVIALILLSLMLTAAITGCGENNNVSNAPASAVDGNVMAEPVQNEEKPRLVIYHISDDEIELHFTSNQLASVKLLSFLAPAGAEGAYNTCVDIDLAERRNDEICPCLMVFDEAMVISYTVDTYGEEMEVTVEGNTLICRISHENIIEPFAKAEIWRVDAEDPQSFEGIITDDVPAIIEPVVEGVLPDEFKRSEYDEQYFKPDSDDFILLTYEIPIRLLLPEWYQYYGRVWHYGLYHSEKESNVKITYLISYVEDNYSSTKLRLEFASVDDAMVSSLVYDYDIVPLDLGLPDEPDDSLVTAEFFADCDQRCYGALEESDHDVLYHGHFDQFRYFEYKVHDTLPELKTLVSAPLTEHSDMLAFVPVSSLSYSAGDTQTCELLEYSGNVAATTYSSKRTHQAGSDNAVLDEMFEVPADKDYFKPLTDDYVYLIYSQSGSLGDDYYEQKVYLYSFDESGNLVQYIQRICSDFEHGDNGYMSYVPEAWLGATEYVETDKAMYTDMLALFDTDDLIYGLEEMTHKENLLFELMKQGQHEGFYFSKP